MKLSPNHAVLAGKRVMLIDDSIVRGTNSVRVVRMVREAGAVFSYLLARDKQEENADDASKQSDRDRAVAVALYLDRVFPNDPATDSVRLRIGQLSRPGEAVPGRVRHPRQDQPHVQRPSPVARAIQGRAAFLLVAGKDSPLTPQQKAAVFTKAVADCEAVPRSGRRVRPESLLRRALAAGEPAPLESRLRHGRESRRGRTWPTSMPARSKIRRRKRCSSPRTKCGSGRSTPRVTSSSRKANTRRWPRRCCRLSAR